MENINDLPHITTRDQLPHLLKGLNLNGMGAEVGVREGEYSEMILAGSNLSILYSIDSWTEFNQKEYKDIANVSQKLQDYRYLKTIIRLMKFRNRSVCLRMKSEEAVKLFKDNSLDFIYLDANHSYKNCKLDITIWWPKLKKGGLFAGHDYLNGNLPAGIFGVKKAVDEFVGREKLKLFTTKEKKYPSWYLIKS